MEFKTSSFHLSFKIEQLPDGSFIARCPERNIELHGATREEVQAKLRDKLRELTGVGADVDIPMGAAGKVEVVSRKTVRFGASLNSVQGQQLLSVGDPKIVEGNAPLTPASRARRGFPPPMAVVLIITAAIWAATSSGIEGYFGAALLFVGGVITWTGKRGQ